MSSSARSSLLFTIKKKEKEKKKKKKKIFPGKCFRVLEQVKGTKLLWFGDNNNYELTIIEG